MAALEIITGARAGEIVDLTETETLIGRHPACSIVLPLHTVSRRHTLIRHSDGGYTIQDLESLNGTYVNGERVEAATRLKNRDVIQLFDIVMVFHEGPVVPEGSTFGEANLNLTLHLLQDDTTDPPDAQEVLSAADVNRQSHIKSGADVKLTAVLEITRSLSGSLDVAEVLPKILDNLFFVFPQANRAYILLADEHTGELKPRATKRRDRKETFGPMSRSIAQRVMSQREAILSSDMAGEGLSGSDSLSELHIRSMMCAPLMGPSQVPLGIIHVETNEVLHRFQREDLDVLVTIATVAGQALEYARAHEALLRWDRKEREMNMARDVQLQFLPQRLPELPGYRFFHHYEAAQEVGGDYYGYIPLNKGRLAVAVADVSGKGVPAALLMARLCSEIRACLHDANTLGEALTRLNREHLESMLGGRFVTLAICLVDPRKDEVTVANAGHLSPLLRRAATREVVELGTEAKGLPLGFGTDHEYGQFTERLEPGDVVLMYTDGLNDSQNPEGEFYGHARVRDLLANGPADVQLLGDVLLQHVNLFVKGQAQNDDMCIVGFSRERAV